MDALLLLLLEALAAMALFIGIVWWTWPRKKRDRNDADSGN
jgi:cbb3-type cytochrome oxidase subunit 3